MVDCFRPDVQHYIYTIIYAGLYIKAKIATINNGNDHGLQMIKTCI